METRADSVCQQLRGAFKREVRADGSAVGSCPKVLMFLLTQRERVDWVNKPEVFMVLSGVYEQGRYVTYKRCKP